jgi:methylase of polypeptide subunit release factors
MLRPGGKLYFEINRAHGKETVEMLAALGYANIELRKDFAENDRMIRAVKLQIKHSSPALRGGAERRRGKTN